MYTRLNILKIVVVLLLVILTGCTTAKYTRGIFLRQSQLRNITVGTTTEEDLKKELGTPQFVSLFGVPTWYYAGTKKETFMSFAPDVKDRDIYSFTFDDKKILKGIHFYDFSHGRDIAMDSHKTPLPEAEQGFFDRFFGNVGAVMPLGATGGQAGGR